MEPRKTLKTARNILFLFLIFISEVSGNDWHYKGNAGPKFWHQLFTTCSGTKQSPINIIAQDTVYDPALTEFAIWFNPPHPEDHMIVFNNGHTVKVRTIGKFYIANGGLPNVYKTAQLHFHWGLEDDLGSEHQIDSASYPMELHIVNYDHSKYSSVQEAMTNPLGLAVLGVMFKVTEEDNPALKPIMDVFGEIQQPGHPKIKINAQSIRVFLPEDTSKYYRYNGSLTTPGCYETVIWTIFKQTNYISHGQMKKLRELFYNKEIGGHPFHQRHHHDHDRLMEEEIQATILGVAVENQQIAPALEEEDKNQPEIPRQHIEASVKPDYQSYLEQNHKTHNSEIPSETTKKESKQEEAVIGKDESLALVVYAKEDAIVLIKEEKAAVEAIQVDQLPKETSEATSPKPQGNPIVKDQLPKLITDKEEAIPEMQRDASYVQFEIPKDDLIDRKMQHGKHKEHHKQHHHHKHHHVSKRDVEGQATLDVNVASETRKEVLDSSKEETNYLVEGDKKLDLIEDEIYEEITQKIKKINIINNYRPVQPLNDRIVLRSFQYFEDNPVSLTGYEVQTQQPDYVRSKVETVRSSLTRICLTLFITFIANLLRLA